MDALTQDQQDYCEFVLNNKTVKKEDISAFFGAEEVARFELDPNVKAYLAKARVEREKKRQSSQKSHARTFDPEIEKMANDALKSILNDPDSKDYFQAVRMVYSSREAYSTAYNKAQAEKDVAEGNKSRFVPTFVENPPKASNE